VRTRFQQMLETFASQSTGSSNRVTRALLLEEPPSLDAREVTDKNTISQSAVLEHRWGMVDELYARGPSSRVLRLL
jgi:feruloyl-CoA synthase